MATPAPPTDEELFQVAARLGRRLVEAGLQLATAESSTGGMIGHLVTQIPGSSAYYVGGVVAYANEAKQAMLGVPTELIEASGAVSAEVSAAMVAGLLERMPADVGVAVTGIAGPDGGSAEKPVGLTYVAGARRGVTPRVERTVLPHDRDGNKRAAALAAMRLATDLLD